MSERSREGGNARAERRRRLAEALRLNLGRRKAQKRERSAGDKIVVDHPEREGKGESG